MSHSVKVTTAIPSLEDIASDLGITGRRLADLMGLAERGSKAGSSNGLKQHAPAKKAAKKASAKRPIGKRGRSTR